MRDQEVVRTLFITVVCSKGRRTVSSKPFTVFNLFSITEKGLILDRICTFNVVKSNW